jgi:4-hydroxy-tetrahydrodipicolinate reductase
VSELTVAVLGASGRMGRTVCAAVDAADGMTLVSSIDRDDPFPSAGQAQVAVDFTVPAASEANVHALIDLGVHVVVGTSGWTEASFARVRTHLLSRPDVGVLVAPNFAIGAVLATHVAAQAARWFESVEVVELHHPDKLDAPSGTARHTAAAIGAARAAAGLGSMPDATAEGLDGARGAVVDGVHVHAVRLRGLTAHQQVLLGNPGEQLTIRHDSFDRSSFMPGVILAIRSVPARPGLTVGLAPLLGLE